MLPIYFVSQCNAQWHRRALSWKEGSDEADLCSQRANGDRDPGCRARRRGADRLIGPWQCVRAKELTVGLPGGARSLEGSCCCRMMHAVDHQRSATYHQIMRYVGM